MIRHYFLIYSYCEDKPAGFMTIGQILQSNLMDSAYYASLNIHSTFSRIFLANSG